MSMQTSIKRRPTRSPDGSFEQLRREGIRLLQDLSGQQWTDFNLHDPGITMLEQLCYALTDLMHRADLEVVDILTAENGKIDFARQSLHVPEQIYACRPTTVEDIRRALLDKVPSVDNVVITQGRDAGGLMPGLYRIDVRAADLLEDVEDKLDAKPNPVKKIREAFLNMRNIGEDVAEISLIAEEPCRLHAEIEIGGPRDPVDIMADIYDCCDRFLASPPSYRSIADMTAAGIAVDDIFDGPEFQSGIIQADVVGSSSDQIFVGDIGRQIAMIDGVKEVKSVAIGVGDSAPQSGAIDWCWRTATGRGNLEVNMKALRLIVPTTSQSQQTVKLLRRGVPVRIALREAALKFVDLRAARHARRQPDPSRAAYPRPSGTHLELPPFQSSQIHFPAIYGLNHFGSPESATAREKVAMLQLKGFLALCDQVMANAAAQFEHLRDLYSADAAPAQSYWWRMLSNAELPDIDALYKRNNAGLPDIDALYERKHEFPTETLDSVYADIVRNVYSAFDPYADRKSRLLDYLLALYGETFSQDYLRKFFSYYNDVELKYLLLKNKAGFVKDIVLLSRDRVGGFDYSDYSDSAWCRPEKCAGLQRRLCRLLAFDDFTSRSLAEPISLRQLSLGNASDIDSLWHEDDEHDVRLPLDWPQISVSKSGDIDTKVKAILRRPILGLLMKAGLHRSNYRVRNMDGEAQCELLLAIPETDNDSNVRGKVLLTSCASWEEATMVASRLRSSLIGLNQKCDGLHLVEHCLLRPTSRDANTTNDAFYSLRVTLIFPAWTARGHLGDFRRFVDETVQINCPSHVHAQCLWLEFEAMRTFEGCYKKWLKAKAESTKDDISNADEKLDSLAADVVKQLYLNGATAGQDKSGAIKPDMVRNA
jgi:hypothetical protein